MPRVKTLPLLILSGALAFLATPGLRAHSYAAQDLAPNIASIVNSARHSVAVTLRPVANPVPNASNSAILLSIGLAGIAVAGLSRRNRQERESVLR